MTHIQQAIDAIDRQLDELEEARNEIDGKISSLEGARRLLAGTSSSVHTPSTRSSQIPKRREMSDEARKKISDRMQARWAAKRAGTAEPAEVHTTEKAPSEDDTEIPKLNTLDHDGAKTEFEEIPIEESPIVRKGGRAGRKQAMEGTRPS